MSESMNEVKMNNQCASWDTMLGLFSRLAVSITYFLSDNRNYKSHLTPTELSTQSIYQTGSSSVQCDGAGNMWWTVVTLDQYVIEWIDRLWDEDEHSNQPVQWKRTTNATEIWC